MGRGFASSGAALGALASILLLAGCGTVTRSSPAGHPRSSQHSVGAAYGQLPLSFEPNRGQAEANARFLAGGPGYRILLGENGAVLSLSQSAHGRVLPPAPLGMRFLGANPAPLIEPGARLTGTVNYLVGSDRSRWHTGIPTFSRVRYRSLYPGISLDFYGNQRSLEYDFTVAPGADPRSIALGFSGARAMRLDAAGNLVLRVGGQRVRELAPVAYQLIRGRRQPVASRFVLIGARAVGVRTGSYDRHRPLVIDPTLSYSTYLGGSDNAASGEHGQGIAIDAQGSAYVTGITTSTDFPTQSPFQGSNNGGSDAYVAKLNASGTALVYSTYLGGSSNETGYGIAVDSARDAYVTGDTTSTDFPTKNPLQAANNGGGDGFVTELDPTGSTLVYSTYIGGTGNDDPRAIAVDSAGSAYITGQTNSLDYPTHNAVQAANNGGYDAFATKLSPGGSALVYSTYLGGGGSD